MKPNGLRIRRRVFVGAGLALVGAGFWYYWMQAHRHAPVVETGAAEPFVKYAGAGQGGGDPVLVEQADLLDPTPLFIPTARNFGQRPLPRTVVRQPGQVFGDFEAKLDLVQGGRQAGYGLAQEAQQDSLPEIVASGNAAPLAGFGHVDAIRQSLTQRTAFLEVKSVRGAEILQREALTDVRVSGTDFSPVEFLIVVGAAGLIGEPVLSVGSGRDEVDAALRDFLAKGYRLGERLEPGRYVVSVGP